jgi:hypothetical protein
MTFLKGILNDLLQRRLWPVPVALLAAIVAVPVLLSKQAPAPAPLPLSHGPAAGTPVAAVSVNSSPPDSQPSGPSRDPFTQQAQPKTSTTSTSTGSSSTSQGSAASSSTSSGSAASTGSTSSGGSSTSTSTSTSSSGGSGSTTPAVSPVPPGAKPTPAPTGLTAKESYDVALSITNSKGGVNPIDPLERLSPLPSAGQPLVVELGVLQGGHRVLFAVQPGTVVSGPGACTPGPIDCEILSVAQDQVETVSSGSTSVSFAVTGITAQQHPSTSAANAARQAVDKAGRNLLANSPLSALSLFQYQSQIGAVVDLRNLTVGGN